MGGFVPGKTIVGSPPNTENVVFWTSKPCPFFRALRLWKAMDISGKISRDLGSALTSKADLDTQETEILPGKS